jgi:hypothetical protein
LSSTPSAYHSGFNAYWGKESETGAGVAIEELSATRPIGGTNVKFQLLSEDDGSDGFGAPWVTHPGFTRVRPRTTFRVVADDYRLRQVLAESVVRVLQLKKVVVVAPGLHVLTVAGLLVHLVGRVPPTLWPPSDARLDRAPMLQVLRPLSWPLEAGSL